MKFRDLKAGDFFTLPKFEEGRQPDVFVRTQSVPYKGVFFGDAPAVSLVDGAFYFFDLEDEVLPHDKSVAL